MLTAHLVGFAPARGKRVSLARVAAEHAEFLSHCYGDDAFMNVYRLAQNRNQNVEQIRARLTNEQQYPPEQLKRLEWVIEAHDDAEQGQRTPIGLAALANLMMPHRRAELLFGILAQADQKGRQGMEAMLLVMDYAFNVLELNKLVSLVYGHNPLAQDSTLELGFQQEGHLREHIYHAPFGYIDLYQNGLLARDFRANARLQRLSQRILGRDITQTPNQGVRTLIAEELQHAQASMLAFFAHHAQEREPSVAELASTAEESNEEAIP